MARVFIDGHVGTTGLRIHDWLCERDGIALMTLAEGDRKDPAARRQALCDADLAVLCLPDGAAREAAHWVTDAGTRLIDASTAHRVAEGWVYGLPELEPAQRERIRAADRVSNPGCYPTAYLLLVRPLVDAGLLPRDAALAIHAVSGYTGGGRNMIEKWEDPGSGLVGLPFEAPYALERTHKHVPEMLRYSALSIEPQFVPAVGPYRCGMRVEVPLPAALREPGATGKAIWEALNERYRAEPFVRVAALADPPVITEHSFDPRACNDTNGIELHVVPHPSGHVLLIALLDNLGKGAAGAAIQNLNLMLGLEETAGLPA
jgi:N-acetyl-gamma-glutamyl-phosphate reductase